MLHAMSSSTRTPKLAGAVVLLILCSCCSLPEPVGNHHASASPIHPMQWLLLLLRSYAVTGRFFALAATTGIGHTLGPHHWHFFRLGFTSSRRSATCGQTTGTTVSTTCLELG